MVKTKAILKLTLDLSVLNTPDTLATGVNKQIVLKNLP